MHFANLCNGMFRKSLLDKSRLGPITIPFKYVYLSSGNLVVLLNRVFIPNAPSIKAPLKSAPLKSVFVILLIPKLSILFKSAPLKFVFVKLESVT